LEDIGGHPRTGAFGYLDDIFNRIKAEQRLSSHRVDPNLGGTDLNKGNYYRLRYSLFTSGTPLFLAANMSKNLKMAHLLLDHGADITANGSGAPLHAAVIRCDIEMLKVLLDRGADPEQPYPDKLKEDPQFWCSNRGHWHYIFDDIFHRKMRASTASIAILVPFLLRYKEWASR
jgi:ankyrin repeat protein